MRLSLLWFLYSTSISTALSFAMAVARRARGDVGVQQITEQDGLFLGAVGAFLVVRIVRRSTRIIPLLVLASPHCCLVCVSGGRALVFIVSLPARGAIERHDVVV